MCVPDTASSCELRGQVASVRKRVNKLQFDNPKIHAALHEILNDLLLWMSGVERRVKDLENAEPPADDRPIVLIKEGEKWQVR